MRVASVIPESPQETLLVDEEGFVSEQFRSERLDANEEQLGPCGRCRSRVKDTLDGEQNSLLAILVQNSIIGIIFISTFAAVIETVPELEADHPELFGLLERCFTFFFTMEMLTRLWMSDDRCQYVMSGWNLIDIVALLPWYLEQALVQGRYLPWTGLTVQDRRYNAVDSFWTLRMVRVIRIVRLLRVMRIAKAARHLTIIQCVLDGVHGSSAGLLALVMFTCMGTLFAATAVFFLECEEPDTKFTSIPAAIWWALPTVTGVGYGDILPLTVAGKLAGAVTMMCGVLITSVCGALITTTFMEEYQRSIAKTRAEHRMIRRKQSVGALAGPCMNEPTSPGMTQDTDCFVDRLKNTEQLLEELLDDIDHRLARANPRRLTFPYFLKADKEATDLHEDQAEHLKFLREQSKVLFRQVRHIGHRVGMDSEITSPQASARLGSFKTF